MQKEKPKPLITPEFRASFPVLLTPETNRLNNELEYSVTALFKKGENLEALKAASLKAVVDRWGADKTKWPKGLKSPFRDQGERTGDGYVPGAVFITFKAKAKYKPGVVDENLQPIIDSSAIYSGCYGRAEVSAFAYPKAGVAGVSPGVAFGLRNFQKTRDGESLSGRNKPEDVFEPIAGAVEEAQGAAGGVDPFKD